MKVVNDVRDHKIKLVIVLCQCSYCLSHLSKGEGQSLSCSLSEICLALPGTTQVFCKCLLNERSLLEEKGEADGRKSNKR